MEIVLLPVSVPHIVGICVKAIYNVLCENVVHWRGLKPQSPTSTSQANLQEKPAEGSLKVTGNSLSTVSLFSLRID